MMGKFIFALLVLQIFELAKQNVINVTTTTPKIMVERTTSRVQQIPDRGYFDDTEEVVNEIEILRIMPLIAIPTVSNVTTKITNETVAGSDLVQYISEVQAVVVALRHSYLDLLRGHAEWTARWYEVHFPDFYSCVTRNLIRLMRESMVVYPKKVIIKIRKVKDALLRSYITTTPISKVDPEVFDGLSLLLESMPEVLKELRDGKGEKVDGVDFLLETRVRLHEEQVRDRCKIPLTDGRSYRQEDREDPDYTGDEDYSPVDYFRI